LDGQDRSSGIHPRATTELSRSGSGPPCRPHQGAHRIGCTPQCPDSTTCASVVTSAHDANGGPDSGQAPPIPAREHGALHVGGRAADAGACRRAAQSKAPGAEGPSVRHRNERPHAQHPLPVRAGAGVRLRCPQADGVLRAHVISRPTQAKAGANQGSRICSLLPVFRLR
jgi:hypothetical protein